MSSIDPSARIVAKTVLPVADMDEAVDFYRHLRFDVERYDDGYAWVRHGGEEILHLWLMPELDRLASNAAGCFHVADADFWHAAWASEKVSSGHIEDRSWGMREFWFTDPSGNLIRVGHNL